MMHWLLDLRLIVLTAGTLLPFFWMVVILGHRRQRDLERIFFFLCLALTSFFGCSLLQLNAVLYYGTPREGLLRFCWTLICLGLWSIPPLVLHLHVEYAGLQDLLTSRGKRWMWLIGGYAPAILLLPKLVVELGPRANFPFERPAHALGVGYQVYLVVALALAAVWQYRFSRVSPDAEQKSFHGTVTAVLACLALVLPLLFAARGWRQTDGSSAVEAGLLVLALLPLGLLIGRVPQFRFLQIGRQRNLIFAVFGVFLALLYLSLVRRAGLWLEAFLPPEATGALLLFLPVIFFEPLQRGIRRLLQQTAQRELDSVYPLVTKIHAEASKGDLRSLVAFIEEQVAENFQFERAWLAILEPEVGLAANRPRESGGVESFSVYRPGRLNAVLIVRPHGSMVSGEAIGALKILSESVAGAIDMCIALEQKLQLERELAERERLALVGQMAASISHNLKNPLGSIKTILQVQMESPELPASLRGETQMVLDEINRLSAKLNQLLQFSRPGARAGDAAQSCDLRQVAESVANVLRHAAEEQRISLQCVASNGAVHAVIGEEAANDILSNVLLNAIEAAPPGGHVFLSLQSGGNFCIVSVKDDGPGISPADRAKVLRPFFTTKARGTGLGLAIVDRRLEEVGGSLEIESPLAGGHGTEVRLRLPLLVKEQAG